MRAFTRDALPLKVMEKTPQDEDRKVSWVAGRDLFLCAILLALATLTVSSAISAMDRVGIAYRPVDLTVVMNLVWGLSHQREHGADEPWVAFLGDSTAVAYPPGKDLPSRFSEQLQARMDAAPAVKSLGAFGMSPLEYYATVDMVVDAAPRWAILAVS